jgi:hypothetical protein
MRAEANKLEVPLVKLAVDPLAAERVIEIAARQQLVLRPHVDGFEEFGVEMFAVPS